jgi:integrase/recombinase XerD
VSKVDPKKDPARRCLKVNAWPEADRRAWQAALREGDIFEPAGIATRWAARTRHKVAVAYGRWLTWLERVGRLDAALGPADRITPTNVRQYIADLQSNGNSSYTVLGRVRDLVNAITAIAPEQDWGWLRRLARRLRRTVKSVRNKRARVVPSELILALGLELMADADRPSDASMFERASRYRDGLMIALLAARPLRRRNFASIEIGRHLVKVSQRYSLRFDAAETKTGAPIDDFIPIALNIHLERYLFHYRPFLAGRTGRWKNRHPGLRPPGMSLWVSTYCSAMSEGAIYDQIRKVTRARFGHALNPHLFRDCAATSIATEDPEHVYIVKSVLGHGSLQTSEKYYNHAQSLDATRQFQQFILTLRRRGRDGQNPANRHPEPDVCAP